MNDKQLITMLENQNPDVINQMAGVLLSGWLPDGIVRKILLFGSLVAGIVLAISHGTAWTSVPYRGNLLTACRWGTCAHGREVGRQQIVLLCQVNNYPRFRLQDERVSGILDESPNAKAKRRDGWKQAEKEAVRLATVESD